MRDRHASQGQDRGEALTDAQLEQVVGGQGIDIVRMPPKPRDPNEDFVVSDRRPFVD